MKRKYLDKFLVPEQLLDSSKWEEVYIEHLTKEAQKKFLARKQAIDLFLKSEQTANNISLQTNVAKSEIYRLLTKCLTLKDANTVYGYEGLLPNIRIRPYKTAVYENGNSGNFSKLLEDYPDLKTLLLNEYFNLDKKVVREKIQTIKNIHRKFIDKCRELGIREGQYPLNSTSKGYKSVERYLRDLLSKHSVLGAKMQSNDALLLAKGLNNSTNAYTQLIRPYERVEFDAHQIDAIFSIITYTPQGDKIVNTMNRLWLLCVIDVASRAIIGYHISYNNSNYSADEVLRCFKNALLPWEPKELTIPTLHYNKGDGFPSYVIEKTKFALWDEICFDNAKAHHATAVITQLLELNCSINFGPVATPTRRGIIERFFKTLEFNGFHRLPSTTGSNVLDPKRDRAEENSIIYEITVEELEEVIDVVIANYNNTNHSAHFGVTPLETINNRLNRGMYIRKLPEHKRSITTLFPIKHTVKVQGNIRKGRNPYIFYKYERYTSQKLTNDSSMIGQTLTLVIDENNIQTVKAFNSDGSFYDTLIVKGVWSKIPHSLNIRLMIMKHKNTNEFNYLNHKDPIESYQDYLTTKSISDKKSRIKLKEIERYKKENKITVQLQKKQEEIDKINDYQSSSQQKVIEKREPISLKPKYNELANVDDFSEELDTLGTDNENLVSQKTVEDCKTIDKDIRERHKKIIAASKNKKGKSITF